MKFEVVIRNLTPVFSAAPGASTVTLEGVINPPEGVSRFPLTRMRTMGVVADSGDGEVRVEIDSAKRLAAARVLFRCGQRQIDLVNRIKRGQVPEIDDRNAQLRMGDVECTAA